MPAPPVNSWPGARASARAVDHRRPAGARRGVDRGRDARTSRAERQATAARRDPPSVRLARDRPGRAGHIIKDVMPRRVDLPTDITLCIVVGVDT
jgi:hypothetical protein